MDNGSTTVVSTKGQVIIPKVVREHYRWEVGTRLMVEETPDGVLLRALPVFARTGLDAVVGRLAYSGPAKSLEDMDAAIQSEAQRHNDRD